MYIVGITFRQTVPQRWPGSGETAVAELVTGVLRITGHPTSAGVAGGELHYTDTAL